MNGNPVLLVHGIDDTAALFSVLEPFLRANGFDVRTIDLLPNNGDVGLDILAQQIATFVQRTCPDGERLDIVAFSMGGLIARYYIQRLGGIDRIDRFVTLSSPHNGTLTGLLRNNAGARQMRLGSEFIRDLNSDVAMLDRIRFTSIWTPLDLMIVPATSSIVSAGKSIRVNVAVHPWMVRDPTVLQLVDAVLRESPGL